MVKDDAVAVAMPALSQDLLGITLPSLADG